jgi:hypothetical protein
VFTWIWMEESTKSLRPRREAEARILRYLNTFNTASLFKWNQAPFVKAYSIVLLDE